MSENETQQQIKRKYIKSGKYKSNKPRAKRTIIKYKVYVKRYQMDNYFIGEFCTREEIVERLNALHICDYKVTRYMIDEYFYARNKSNRLNNIIEIIKV